MRQGDDVAMGRPDTARRTRSHRKHEHQDHAEEREQRAQKSSERFHTSPTRTAGSATRRRRSTGPAPDPWRAWPGERRQRRAPATGSSFRRRRRPSRERPSITSQRQPETAVAGTVGHCRAGAARRPPGSRRPGENEQRRRSSDDRVVTLTRYEDSPGADVDVVSTRPRWSSSSPRPFASCRRTARRPEQLAGRWPAPRGRRQCDSTRCCRGSRSATAARSVTRWRRRARGTGAGD